ncbi:MAG: hypothetical protein QMD95_02065 [Candidatus Hodarchaeaceae archaeon]|nr:hypothetical protein [Candidatus Hodarchaeaceae archaeon]
MQVRVDINYISAERFWGRDEPAPAGVHISTNVNIVGVEPKEEKLAIPFVVTIGYTPSVAQINIKGQAMISGTSEEIKKIHGDYKSKKPPPPILLQAITNTSLIEATVISRTLNIPPPVPLPGVHAPQKPDKERPSYVG